MATKKLKVQGYVEQATFNLFEAYKQENELSQSQALEKILASFFGGDRISQKEAEDYYSLKMDWEYTKQELEKLQERVSALEIKSNLPSESQEEITNISPSNLSESTSDLPSESPEEITNISPNNLSESTSDLPSESPSNLSEIKNNLLSDTPEITSESPKLVVCKLYKNNPNDPQFWRYWAGAKLGFIEDLSKAKTYTEKGSSKVINQLLEDELHKPTSRERISCRALEELKVFYEESPVIC